MKLSSKTPETTAGKTRAKHTEHGQLAPGAALYVETSTGTYSIQETHNGGLQITAQDLHLAVIPQVSNRVTLHPMEAI